MARLGKISRYGIAFRRRRLMVARYGALWAALLLVVVGCGKKAPPMAPEHRPLTVVTDLKASLDQSHVRLTWTHNPENRYAKAYVILRAQRRLPLSECKDCPKVFQKVGEIPLIKSLRGEKHELDFSQSLASGFHYIFSVRPIHSSGAQGPDSNFAVVEVPASVERAKDVHQ